ncbi:MAG: peptide-methionine (S)-S-oxide reductase [Alphaproteobacteria bacterium]|jgi:peptide-methionine (S)-S-oxide reductase|nr:peptide-methionine (S)-S-oxide reductase [Alphaproteobacteria bacterium]MBL12897.1 peptide-methionine (S)-S-oxide reductase [Rhodospirillaceae bacterium]|tara:strand:+ start:1575 stop:2033 length:459 start_codon:yes stop_codon:yes gene_type:complete
MEKATFAAGCFWGIETAYRRLEGVLDVAVGYEGGSTDNPSYQDVCTGQTGHAEVVEVDYDPEKISYDELLEVFWNIHDPTTLNRQGPDIGTQYRSAIFFHNEDQKKKAELSKSSKQSEGTYPDGIVTEITPHETFYRAEEYHQRYFEKMGRH